MRRLLAVLVVMLVLAATATAQGQAVQLTILYTSEHHGNLLPFDTPTAKGVGGMAARATVVAQVRQAASNVLLLDSGDILVGTAMSTIFRGEPDVLAMNLIGYDAMAAGNHEFDYGLDHFARLRGLAKFPIISTSLRGRGREVAPIFVIKQLGGLRVLIFSGLDDAYADIIHPAIAAGLEYFDPIGSARGLVNGLGRSVDLIIALTHMTDAQDLALARAVPQIHAVIGGHVEGYDGILTAAGGRPVETMDNPPTILVRTHRQGATVGRLDLLVEGGRVRRASARNLPVTSQVTPDPKVADLVKDYESRLRARFAEVIGRTAVLLDGERANVRSRETNLGNLIADALREFARTDVAIVNGGNIRSSINEGPITLADVFRVLAFDNTVVTLQLTGAQLREALENGVSQVEEGSGRFPQVSGMSYVYERARPRGQRVVDVRVGGQPLDPARLYSMATNDFLADGGDGYAVFKAGRQRRDTQVDMRDVFIEYVRRVGTVSARLEGRITAR
ncbi:MAG: 5'-nucleotidase C-terminal domain-containing protein [Armatimonadetes bacterium]|nr:5'-nucleotidase C-terminal domain-containing protein [Armatimonadota bacterium]